MYHIAVAAKDVFIVTYGCTTTSRAAPVLSQEHSQIGEFCEDEVSELPMPEGYKRSIATWLDRLRTRQAARCVPSPGPVGALCHQQRRGQAVSARGVAGK